MVTNKGKVRRSRDESPVSRHSYPVTRTPSPISRHLVCVLALLLAPAMLQAQTYPARAIRLIVPSSAGSGADFTARLIAQPLSERLGQQVAVDNRAGASTMIGTELVAKSAPDGYTVLLGVGTMATVPAMYRKVPYDVQRDLVPIAQLVSVANVLVVHPSLPAKSVKELVALARARPGEIAFASSGTGTLPHLSMELLLVMTGTKMLHVAYKGPGPGLLDLVAGRVSAMTTSTAAALPHVRSGRLRLLGVTAARRIPAVPDAPTIAEAGVPGYESANWWGLLVPAGTAGEIITRLNREAVAIMAIPSIRERCEREGMTIVTGTPQEFAAHIRTEIEKWSKIVKRAGIQPE
jgi:tripartite-type tricarboxylate transporter receptor subunit TctC